MDSHFSAGGTEPETQEQLANRAEDQNRRHKHWAQRNASSALREAAWRPRRRFRLAAAKWLCMLDNQEPGVHSPHTVVGRTEEGYIP